MSIHYFSIDTFKHLIRKNDLIDLADDNGDGEPDDGVLEACREIGENDVKSRVEVRYDPTQWDVDEDEDGISENAPGILVDCAVKIAIYNLWSRSTTMPETVQFNYNEAKMILEMIADGRRQLGGVATDTTTAKIATNMTVDDLGELTENGEPLVWSGIL